MYRIITLLFSTALFRLSSGDYSGYYEKLSEDSSGDGADTACLNEFGTNVATVRTQEDNERASDLCGAGEQCFIGLKRKDRSGEGGYYWGSDGEVASSTYVDYPHFWATYQPDEVGYAPKMTFYKKNWNKMCDIPLGATNDIYFKKKKNNYGCTNDDAKKARIYRADAGTKITIYDTDPPKTNDDYLVIEVIKDIYPSVVYAFGTFEASVTSPYIRATYHKKNNLDGKVSTVKVTRAPTRSYVAINGDGDAAKNWYDVDVTASPVICDRPDYCANVTCVNNSCQTGACDAATGLCDYALTDCNDEDNCTHDTCDADTGCDNIAIDCSDGNACNGEEYCEAETGQCKDGADLVCEAGFLCNVGAKGCVRDCGTFAIDGYLTDCSLEFNNNEMELAELVKITGALEQRINGHDDRLANLSADIVALQNEDALIYDKIQFISDDITVLKREVETIYGILGEYKSANGEKKESVYAQLDALTVRLDAFIPVAKHGESDTYQGLAGQSVIGVPGESVNGGYNNIVVLLLVGNMVLFVAFIVVMIYYWKYKLKRENRYERVKYSSASEA